MANKKAPATKKARASEISAQPRTMSARLANRIRLVMDSRRA